MDSFFYHNLTYKFLS